MKIVDRYCGDIQRHTKKLLKKIFGYRNITVGMKERLRCRARIEGLCGKKLGDISFDLIKEKGLCYEYARYRTLDKVLELYTESVCLQKFSIKELEEYGSKRV